MATRNSDLGIIRLCRVIRSSIKDQRGAGDQILTVADLTPNVACAVKGTALNCYITSARNDTGTVRDVERTAGDDNVVFPRSIDTTGDIAIGNNATVEGTTYNLDLVRVTITISAVTGDYCIVGSVKRTIFNPDVSPGCFARDYGTFASLIGARINEELGPISTNCNCNVFRRRNFARLFLLQSARKIQSTIIQYCGTFRRNSMIHQINGDVLTLRNNDRFSQLYIHRQLYSIVICCRVNGSLQRFVFALAFNCSNDGLLGLGCALFRC